MHLFAQVIVLKVFASARIYFSRSNEYLHFGFLNLLRLVIEKQKTHLPHPGGLRILDQK
jgi:hypothetical protein